MKKNWPDERGHLQKRGEIAFLKRDRVGMGGGRESK